MLLTAMSPVEILTSVIQIITGGLSAMATGIGGALSSFATSIFLNADQSDLSTFGAFVCIFAGISLSVSLGRKICSWLGSLGGSRI